MVKSFQFSRLPKIYFKNGMITELASLASRFGKKMLLITGKGSFLNSINGEKLILSLKKSNIESFILSVPGEPSPDIIDLAVKRFNNEAINLVVGIGGGSVLDAGKAVSAMMNRTESVVEFLEGVGNKEHPGTKLPFIAIPTTSGTGSEATKNAVISQIGKYGFKRSLRHDNFVPDVAIVDPELTLHCPRMFIIADAFKKVNHGFISIHHSRNGFSGIHNTSSTDANHEIYNLIIKPFHCQIDNIRRRFSRNRKYKVFYPTFLKTLNKFLSID